jgi:hypothetical protein
MSISINNLLRQFRVQLPILTTLPEVVPAGAEFYYQGTKWRGLGAGESSLPEGTPWPVKGYKEVVARIAYEGSEPSVMSIITNDFVNSINIIQASEGVYDINLGVDLTGFPVFVTSDSAINSEDGLLVSLGSAQIVSGSVRVSTVSPIEANLFTSIRIYPPQP